MKLSVGDFGGEFALVDFSTMRVLMRGLTRERADSIKRFLEDDRAMNGDEKPSHPEIPRFDFESIYKKYPRKIGKTLGFRWLRQHVRSQEKFDALERAVAFYALYCAQNSIEEQFIKHFSTWVKSYEDWDKAPVAAIRRSSHDVLEEVPF